MATTLGKAARRAARQTAPGAALALGATLLGWAGVAGPAAAATLIRACNATLDRPGTYVLAGDLTCPGDVPAITVAADGVRLDLGGNTLTGGGESQGILADGSPADPIAGLRVANGRVTGFRTGVVILDAPGARIAGVTVAGNAGIGMIVSASPDARIEGNRATGNGTEGISTSRCDRCRIAGNRATGNPQEGIIVLATEGARIEGNTANGNGQAGIDLDGPGNDGNLVRGNTANGNGTTGIEVGAGSTGNRLEGNRATGNGTVDLEDVSLPGACANAWRGNRFATDNEGDGLGAGCIR